MAAFSLKKLYDEINDRTRFLSFCKVSGKNICAEIIYNEIVHQYIRGTGLQVRGEGSGQQMIDLLSHSLISRPAAAKTHNRPPIVQSTLHISSLTLS